MGFLRRLFGQSEENRKEYVLTIEGPEWGSVGEKRLLASLNNLQVPVANRYGKIIKEVKPFVATDVGKIILGLETRKITQQQAEEITQFVKTLLKENRP